MFRDVASGSRRLVAAVAIVAAGAVAAAQPLSRLRGLVVSQIGAPIESANMRVEALWGFLGGDFTGQRTFSFKTNAKGEWALIGFKAGVWVFEATAPDRLPNVVALPFNVSVPPSSGVAGDVPPWRPVLRLAPVPDTPAGELLAKAADAASAGRAQEVVAALSRLADSNDPETLVAAGRICLVLRDAATARPFFRRALDREPKSFAATLGMATTALMQRDFDAAGHAYGAARECTADKDERRYLTAAIADVNKVAIRLKNGPY